MEHKQTIILLWHSVAQEPEDYGYYLCSDGGSIYRAYYASSGYGFGPWYWSEEEADELRRRGPEPKYWSEEFETHFDKPE